MSATNKLRGGSESELTKFKKLWRDSLSEPARDYWRELFCSAETQAAIRKQLFTRLKINLQRDNQLTAFRGWLDDQDARDAQAERMEENEFRIKSAHPDWTLDQVREEVLKQSYFEVLATGDYKAGRQTVFADMRSKEVTLDRDKFQFDAAKAALKCAAELKVISSDKKLSEADKVNAARAKLFGVE